jgi:hypothetical protein
MQSTARTARAGCAGHSVTPFPAWLQSVLLWRGVAPPITKSGAAVRIDGQLSVFEAPHFRRGRASTPHLTKLDRVALDGYLTKVREWTRASCNKFAASTAP